MSEDAERAQALAEVLAGLAAIALGEECECRTCVQLRNIDRALAEHESKEHDPRIGH